jgi:hypothetical protein
VLRAQGHLMSGEHIDTAGACNITCA